ACSISWLCSRSADASKASRARLSARRPRLNPDPTMHMLHRIVLAAFAALAAMSAQLAADDGYRLWLRYEPLAEPARAAYAAAIGSIDCPGDSPTLAAARAELEMGLAGLLGDTPRDGAPALLVGTPDSNP